VLLLPPLPLLLLPGGVFVAASMSMAGAPEMLPF
jgi:hypothetical protein